jgi:hypothetical protein
VRTGKSLSNELDFRRVESAREQGRRTVSAHEPVENPIGVSVAQAEIAFVGLAMNQIRRRRL